MESLLEFYPKKFTNFEGNIFELFTKFYTFDLTPIDSWLELQFKNRIIKDNKKAQHYLNEGKSYLNIKDYLRSLKFFTKCLSTATADSEQYSLALDYRSQVVYEIKLDIKIVMPYVLPEFDVTEENNSLAYASAKIKLSYDTKRGRHVITQKPVCNGDILFIEKAFATAPVFTNDEDIYPFKCCNCLKDVISSIPCCSCTVCIYCSETCREVSWQECHRWECVGMQAGIWYYLGIAFPGFRALIKGVRSGFQVIKGTPEEDVKNFGDKNDNYPYFNRLMSHVYKNKNASPYLLMAAVVVRYLCKYTEFFPWLLEQENCPKDDLNALVNYVGGLLTKHIAQLSCNSSVIEHITPTNTESIFPDKVSVACGIFPSVSMMNHSCKANITSFFMGDTIIVKSSEDLPVGQEVFNCYGIDYRVMDRRQRQQACRNLYFFECKCVVCTNPLRELRHSPNGSEATGLRKSQ